MSAVSVNGLPGAGGTTLARKPAREPELPLPGKDALPLPKAASARPQ
ncbi:hypothetical protein ACWCQN_37580 [Streptomyces sp. NPDC001984]